MASSRGTWENRGGCRPESRGGFREPGKGKEDDYITGVCRKTEGGTVLV